MKTLAALLMLLGLGTVGCGYCPPGYQSRSEVRRARDDFRRAGWEAREELRRARQDVQRELRQAREDFRRELHDAHRELRDEFRRW